MANQHDPYANGGPDEVFVAPPTSPSDDDFDFTEPPGWPKVVGIFSILFASLGLVCGGVGLVWMFVGPGMMQSAAGNMEGGMPPSLTTRNTTLLAITMISTIWAVLLLVSGILTIQRKPVARLSHLVWAAGAIVLTVVSIKMQLDMQAEMAQWMKDNPSAEFTMNAKQGGGAGNLIGLVLGIVLGLSWPTFCFIWFGLIKTKPEQMTGGIESPAA